MKYIRIILPILALFAIVVLVSALTLQNKTPKETTLLVESKESGPTQSVNLFVTHGHCSTPFNGTISNLTISTTGPTELIGNPMEGLRLQFDIDPESFTTCIREDVTERIKTPGLFIGENEEKITFRSTNVYTMGMDWYQINGKLSIKGVEKDVKFFATGIRSIEETMPKFLILEAQMDLSDWGIDYDLIVHGESNSVPTKWMHMNMKIDMANSVDKC